MTDADSPSSNLHKNNLKISIGKTGLSPYLFSYLVVNQQNGFDVRIFVQLLSASLYEPPSCKLFPIIMRPLFYFLSQLENLSDPLLTSPW